jgi:RNA polymerase sigma-70 factor (ECF subfamily)
MADVDLAGIDGELESAAARDAEEASEALHAALETLPVVEREVLVLFYLRELSLAEIGGVLGIPAGTVKSRLFRSRNMLRDQLSSKGVTR